MVHESVENAVFKLKSMTERKMELTEKNGASLKLVKSPKQNFEKKTVWNVFHPCVPVFRES